MCESWQDSDSLSNLPQLGVDGPSLSPEQVPHHVADVVMAANLLWSVGLGLREGVDRIWCPAPLGVGAGDVDEEAGASFL